MSAALTEAAVVWIADGGDAAEPASVTFAPPSDDASRSLDAWATARGMKLRVPSEERAPSKAIDWTAAEDAERATATAREALVGLDFDAADKALGRAETVLHEHPELPQAAWLLAEVERAWSARWLRSGGDARGPGAPSLETSAPNLEKAKLAWQRAAALDGGRAPGLGEKAWDPPVLVSATIRLEGADRGTSVRVDGQSVAPGDLMRAEGEHAVAVVRADGSIASATWETWSAGGTVKLTTPDAPACSQMDVGRARLASDHVVGSAVACERWVAAIAGAEAGVVRVATCERETCGPFVEWRVTSSSSWTYAPIAPVETRSHWPAWATWTIAGVGVAGASLAILAAAGTFKSAPTETQFVNGGLKVR